MRMKSIIKIAVGLLSIVGLLWFASCASLGRIFIEKPKVTFDHVSVRDPSSTGITVIFGFEVENPNPFEIKVDSIQYKADIGAHSISSGEIKNIAAVAAKSKAIVELPVNVKFSDLFASILDFLQKQSTSYHLMGEVQFGPLSIPFDEKGEFKVNH